MLSFFPMDVKSAFLNGYIKEEVYVSQPPGFIDYGFPNLLYKLKKAIYGLKQAHWSWYERLSNFLLEQKFERGKVDTTLLIKKTRNDILLVQIYMMTLYLVLLMMLYVKTLLRPWRECLKCPWWGSYSTS